MSPPALGSLTRGRRALVVKHQDCHCSMRTDGWACVCTWQGVVCNINFVRYGAAPSHEPLRRAGRDGQPSLHVRRPHHALHRPGVPGPWLQGAHPYHGTPPSLNSSVCRDGSDTRGGVCVAVVQTVGHLCADRGRVVCIDIVLEIEAGT
eukprot:2802401-Rhodomonas_salina.3